MREFSIFVLPYAKLRRCSSFSCDVRSLFLASSRSSCRWSVMIHLWDMTHFTTAGAEENPVSLVPRARVLPVKRSADHTLSKLLSAMQSTQVRPSLHQPTRMDAEPYWLQ